MTRRNAGRLEAQDGTQNGAIEPAWAGTPVRPSAHRRLASHRLAAIGRSRWFVVAAGLVAVLSGTALVLAMWSSSATEAGGVITTGELKAIAGTFEWAETTPDVASTARQSGTDTASLAQFHAMPGDSLEIRQGVEVKGSGENLRFDVEASWSGGSNAAISPLEAEYVVTNSAGQILAGGPSGVSLGTPVQIEGLTEGQHELFVVVTLTYPASSDLVYQASAGSSSQVASLPVLNFAAQQVRETS